MIHFFSIQMMKIYKDFLLSIFILIYPLATRVLEERRVDLVANENISPLFILFFCYLFSAVQVLLVYKCCSAVCNAVLRRLSTSQSPIHTDVLSTSSRRSKPAIAVFCPCIFFSVSGGAKRKNGTGKMPCSRPCGTTKRLDAARRRY